MRIGFDARMISHSGIGTYIRGILPYLTADGQFDFTLFGNLSKIQDYDARKVLSDSPIYSIKEQIAFPSLLKRNPVDLLHVPHYNAPLGYSGKMVVTVHDLIHLRFPPSRLAYFYARVMFETVCKKARMIIADSRNTKRDILEFIRIPEEKVRIIYPAVSDEFSTGASGSNGSNPEPYLLYIGNVRQSKNIKTLVDAFLIAREKTGEGRLIIAGKNFMPDYTKQYESHRDVRFLGEVPHSDLPKLYREARIFVYPSLYEGFGLPPLEAMASGTPVICSNAASLPEVVGDSALLFNPENPGQLAEQISGLWGDETRRKEFARKGIERAKRFSWKTCAREIAEVYRQCA